MSQCLKQVSLFYIVEVFQILIYISQQIKADCILKKVVDSGIPFALLLPFQQFTTVKFFGQGIQTKLYFLSICPSPKFKVDGRQVQVDYTVWVIGNMENVDGFGMVAKHQIYFA